MPWAEKLARRQFGFREQARVRNEAPSQYCPGAVITLSGPRIIEEDESSALPTGTLVYTAQFPDCLMKEVPEEWLERITPTR